MSLLSLLIGLALALAAGGGDVEVLRLGQPLQATLVDGDAPIETEALRAGGYLAQQPVLARRFRLEVPVAGEYRVELRSHAFDGYLVALDDGGRVLAEDDDGLLGMHARLQLRLTPDAPVDVAACALHGQRGDFELRFEAGWPPPLPALQRAEAEIDDLRQRLAVQEAREGAAGAGPAATRYLLGERLRVLGRLDEAEAQLEAALASFEAQPGGQPGNVAAVLNGLALVHSVRGELAAARRLDERALALNEQTYGARHPFVATSLNNLGLVLVASGEPEAARPLYERALAISQEAYGPQHPQVAAVLSNLASMHRALGDLASARPLYERALSLLEAAYGGQHPDVATLLDNLGLLATEQGDAAGAVPLLARALAIREAARGPQHPEVAATLLNSAVALQATGASALARAQLVRALAIFEAAFGPGHPSVATALNELGQLLVAQADLEGARPLLERALAVRLAAVGPSHPDVATSLNNLALLHQQLGDAEAARSYFERALAIQERMLGLTHPHVAAHLNNLACLLADVGAFDEAITWLRRGSAARDAHLGTTLAGFGEGEGHTYLGLLRWQLELQQSALAWGAPAREVYESQLAWKGRVLRLTRGTVARLRSRSPAEAGPLLAALQGVQRQLSRALDGAGVVPGASSVDCAGLAARRLELERQLRQLGGPLVDGVPGWEPLRAALPEGGALVDVLVQRLYEPAQHADGRLVAPGRWTAPHVLAWVTRPDREQPLRVDLGLASDLEQTIAAAREQLVGSRGAALRPPVDALARARERLWDPLAGLLQDTTTVFISPDGALATLPFEVLRSAEGRFLVQDRGFVYLTDPTELLRCAARPAATPGPMSLLAVGGVDYVQSEAAPAGSRPGSDAVAIVASARERSRQDVWRPLDATRAEAQQVLTRHALACPEATRLLLTGPAASEERLKRELPRHALLHLATHGDFQEAAGDAQADRLVAALPGLLSALVCAGVNRPLPAAGDDGYLTADEVGWLDLSGVELAVLSACDTGLGRAQSGEGLLGLRRAFLNSGARTVIASLWAIDDQDTAELMDRFYRNCWQRGLGRAAALRAAQLEQLEEWRAAPGGDPRPESWGAFILDGDWR